MTESSPSPLNADVSEIEKQHAADWEIRKVTGKWICTKETLFHHRATLLSEVERLTKERDEAREALKVAQIALEPFAAVVEQEDRIQEMDRAARINDFTTVHITGPVLSGGVTLKPNHFRIAKTAERKAASALKGGE